MTLAIDPSKLIGTELPEVRSTWTDADVILYQLGLGAGVPPTSPEEMRYVYERDLMVLPSYASVACTPGLRGFREIPALDLSEVVVLHAEHLVEVRAPIPITADVTHTGRLKDLVDRGGGALAPFEVETRDATTNQLLFRNVAYFYLKGLGGFGKQADEPYERLTEPSRKPDTTVSVTLLPQQAFIYRLSGDRNPMHVDPAIAARSGFPQPLLHGLCTYGVVCKALVDSMLGSEAGVVRSYRARFAGPVFPGETLQMNMWREGERLIASATTLERGELVLVGAVVLR